MNTRKMCHCPASPRSHASFRARHAHALALASAFVLVVLMSGCHRRPHQDGTDVPPDRDSQPGTQTGTISAEPNPVPAGSAKGKTIINWSVNEGTGRVYVAIDGGKEELFSGQSGGEAPWIEAGHIYEFRLYGGEDHKIVLGSVKVTRGKQ